MVKAYVSGANGFIGPHLIEYLLKRGDEVVGLIRPTSDLRALAPLFQQYPDRFRLVTGDLRDPTSLGAGMENVEFVFHLGASLVVTSEAEFRKTNVDGTRHILEAAKKHTGPNFKRFLFTSSQAAAGPSPTAAPIDEARTPAPVSWYGESKRDAEKIVHEFSAQGLPVAIVRPVGVYGERETLLATPTFPMVGAGFLPQIGLQDKVACFVYVADVVEAIVAAAESPNTTGKTYFLSNPQPYNPREVMLAIADALQTKVRIPFIIPHFLLSIIAIFSEWMARFSGRQPLATRDKVRETRQRFWAVTPRAAQQDFGWVARHTIQDGMKKTLAFWKQEQADKRAAAERAPRHDRIIQSFTLATAIGAFEAILDLLLGGVIFTGLADFLGLAAIPGWMVFLLITIVFGLSMGFVSLWTFKSPAVIQFLAGAAVGMGLELLNQFVLHWWEWSGAFSGLTGPWLPALILGGAAGLYPLVVNAVVRAVFASRARLGAAPAT